MRTELKMLQQIPQMAYFFKREKNFYDDFCICIPRSCKKNKKHMWETLQSTEETEKEVMSGRRVTGGKMREWNQQN